MSLMLQSEPLDALAHAAGRPELTLAIALLAGMVAQVLARHLRIPGIVLLLLAGVLLGPDVLNVVRPSLLGGALSLIVSAAVAVILFEGGLNLDIVRLRREAPTIRRLVTIGALVTATGGTLAGRYIMGWGWDVAVLFGTLVIVTGPTVITPLLRRIRVNRNVHTILEAEAVLIDPIGAIIAVVALEIVLAQEPGSAALDLLGIPMRLLVGAVIGAVGGLVMARILAAEKILPDGFESVFTLAFLLFLYAISEGVLAETGIMAAPVAGMVVGNTPARPSRQLKEFKEQLTVLLVGLLFILLAAAVRVEEVTAVGWRGLLTVLVLVVVVRPLDVLVSTHGSTLTTRERTFIAWLAPRGIVAAAVASLFAQALTQAGVAEGAQLRAVVFLVIATTVVVQGLSSGLVARVLRIRRPTETGYLIAGANQLARALAQELKRCGEDVVLVDTDPAAVQAARRMGLQVVEGNALDQEVMERVDVEGKYGVVGLIANEGVSLLVVEKVRAEYRIPAAYVVVRPGRSGLPAEGRHAAGMQPLFCAEVPLTRWIGALAAGTAKVRWFRYSGLTEKPLRELAVGEGVLPLVLQRGSRASPADANASLRPGDRLALVLQGQPLLPDLEPNEAAPART